jgi:site-specific DNA-cytosine methylase
MSYTYLLEQGEESLAASYSDIPLSVLSKLNLTQEKCCSQRQRDGILPKFPIWDDVCTFDGIPWRDSIDVICGGFPCQDISSSGSGVGIKGERSGLWKEYARIIGEIRPKFVFAENSPMLRHRGLNIVLQDLASLGYDARWCVLGSRHVGGATGRKRLWLLASARLCVDAPRSTLKSLPPIASYA